MAQATRDQNNVTSLLAVSNADGVTPVAVYADPVTHRLLTTATGGGSGTVTSFSFTDGNGFDGTVTNSTTTPALSLAITASGMLKGSAGALVAAEANTDYQIPIILTTDGSSGPATFDGETLNIPEYTGGSGTVETVVGTANRITVDSTDPANPVVNIAATYVGQASITTLGTIATGTWNATVIPGQYGGTGVANTGKTITVSGNTTIGSNTDTVAFVTAGNTSVTLPTTGTLVNTAVTTLSSLVSVGTITTGTWNASVVAGQYGGTGVANTGKTITVSGNTTIGSSIHTVAFATSNNTSVTLPTTGTLATLTGSEVFTNKTVQAGIIDYVIEPAADDSYEGESTNDLNAGYTTTQWDLVYLASADSRWELADADAAATAGPVLLALASQAGITDGNPLNVVFRGIVRNDGWTWATPGAPLYVSTTAGAMTETAPSGTDDVIRVVGYVISDDCIYFNPSTDWVTHT